jgi:hypothetical protein
MREKETKKEKEDKGKQCREVMKGTNRERSGRDVTKEEKDRNIFPQSPILRTRFE